MKALLTCPWCPWRETLEQEGDRAALVREGKRLVAEHTREAGHPIKAGREPREGYIAGEPVQ